MKKLLKSLLIILLGSILIFMTSCNQDSITDQETSSADSMGNSQKPEQTAENTNSEETRIEYKAATNIPSLFIKLDNKKDKWDIVKEDYFSATYSLVGAEGFQDIIEQPISVKGRGNFSWSFDKRPLTLKLDKKADWLGMGEGKKWVLINNYVDKTLIRNYLTFCFAKDMGLEFTPDCKYVDVYINGEYEGNYLLFEKINIAENRVDIDADKGGILFEIEMQFRHGDCSNCYETPSGVHMMYSDYKENADLREIMKETNRFLEKMDRSLSKGYNEYSKYIDVDSFINWYIVNEFAKNYDSKFVTSCYCYIGDDGKLYMGPVWDYDTCFGNQNTDGCMYTDGFHVKLAPWYEILLNDKDFSRKLKERWTEAMSTGIIDKLIEHVDYADELIKESRIKNFERWPEALDYKLRNKELHYTYEDELRYFKKFINGRKEWLNSVWDINVKQPENPFDGNVLNNKVDISSVKGSSGANGGETCVNIFDENTFTKFCTLESLPVYVQWKMKESVEIKKYFIATANDEIGRNPKEWKFFGSADGKDWTVISDVKDGKLPNTYLTYKEFAVDKPGKYLYYKIEIYNNREDVETTQFSELILK